VVESGAGCFIRFGLPPSPGRADLAEIPSKRADADELGEHDASRCIWQVTKGPCNGFFHALDLLASGDETFVAALSYQYAITTTKALSVGLRARKGGK
jgi:hypothetical protein